MVMTDVRFTELKSDSEIASFLSNCGFPAWIFDQESLRILEVNQSAVHTYGYTRQEFLALTVLDIRPSQEVPMFLEKEVLRHHSSIEPERWRHLRKDNSVLPVDIRSRETIFRGRAVELVIAIPRENTCHVPESSGLREFLGLFW